MYGLFIHLISNNVIDPDELTLKQVRILTLAYI